jgi:hypothetical protein
MEHVRFVGLDIYERADPGRGGGERALWGSGLPRRNRQNPAPSASFAAVSGVPASRLRFVTRPDRAASVLIANEPASPIGATWLRRRRCGPRWAIG